MHSTGWGLCIVQAGGYASYRLGVMHSTGWGLCIVHADRLGVGTGIGWDVCTEQVTG